MTSSGLLSEVLSRLARVKPSGDGYVALCPAHEDHRQSLSLSDGDTAVVMHCHAGCTFEAIAHSIDLPLKALFYESDPIRSSPSPPKEYEYRDENGTLRYVVERREPKDFKQRQPDGNGGWTWNLKGVAPLPYRLPELLAADLNQPVIIVEGEKDVDNLWRAGFIATCNSGGAGKWKDELSDYLMERRVVILPDNDDAGRKHAQNVAERLQGIASRAEILEIPGLPPKGDVSDWLAAGHTGDELRALIDPPAVEADDEFVFASDQDEPPPQRWIVDAWIPEGFVTTLYAHGGSSKSFLSQYIAMCIALGLDVFGHSVVKGPVLFLDGELDRHSWLRRGYMLARGLDLERIPQGLVYRRIGRSILDPRTKREILDFIKKEKPSLTIIDSFTACLPGADTNSLDDVSVRIRALGELGTVLLIDHAAKGSDMTTSATAIGSVAKMMFARSALQIASSESGGSVLQHKKSNFGPLTDAVAYTLNIGGGKAFVDRLEYNDDRLEGIEKALPTHKRIMAAFRGGQFDGGASSKDIAETLDLPEKTVRNRLAILRRKSELINDGRVWKLAPPRPPLTFARVHDDDK